MQPTCPPHHRLAGSVVSSDTVWTSWFTSYFVWKFGLFCSLLFAAKTAVAAGFSSVGRSHASTANGAFQARNHRNLSQAGHPKLDAHGDAACTLVSKTNPAGPAPPRDRACGNYSPLMSLGFFAIFSQEPYPTCATAQSTALLSPPPHNRQKHTQYRHH
jgi:hypothetical protein